MINNKSSSHLNKQSVEIKNCKCYHSSIYRSAELSPSLYSWIASFAIFSKTFLSVFKLLEPCYLWPILRSLVSKWRRYPPASHDMLLIDLLKHFWEEMDFRKCSATVELLQLIVHQLFVTTNQFQRSLPVWKANETHIVSK